VNRWRQARRRVSDHFATLAQVAGVGQFGWTVATTPDPWGFGVATAALAALELLAFWIILKGEEG
jgi:hypothetical protein